MSASRRLLFAAALSGLAGGLAVTAAPSSARADTDANRINPGSDASLVAPLSLSPFVLDRRADEANADSAQQPCTAESRSMGSETLRPAPAQAADPLEKPVYLDDAPAAEKPNIHGFVELPFKTGYVTPRGLDVENKGLAFEPVGGLVFPLGDFGPLQKVAFISGIWNSVNASQGDPRVGAWNEMDIFEALDATVGSVDLTLTYGAWNFPTSTLNKPRTEHVADLKVAFDDTSLKLFGDSGITLHPYLDFFYSIAGSSTVVLGRQGSTGYVELGIVPTYKYTGITSYPLTFTFPTYFSVGPASYWGAGASGGAKAGNFGVFSASAQAAVPLSFIPGRYGAWHADAGFHYFYLGNHNLLEAGDILTGNTSRSIFQGTLGIGVDF